MQSMANPAEFGHDNLGHLLSDKLMTVPDFQRRYSWKRSEIKDYWDDIDKARSSGQSYFMGTVVLATDEQNPGRSLIVDGQQRISTTALLLTAIRDRLREFNKKEAAESVERDHLSNYVLAQEKHIAKLTLAPHDSDEYERLLEGNTTSSKSDGNVVAAYKILKELVDDAAQEPEEYRVLIDLVTYLDSSVQVLLAIASGISEAYVIFETLNDRGADLTTADLLKNYLFSTAQSEVGTISQYWTELSSFFDKPDDLVKFLRQDYMSRKGRVTHRDLYKSLRDDVGNQPRDVKRYVRRLQKSFQNFKAIGEPDDRAWSSEPEEVRDALLALRRFRFESAMPLLLAVFENWTHHNATKFANRLVGWFIRAWTVDSLGGSTAEKAICDAAVAVTSGTATSANEVLDILLKSPLIPDDARFRTSFVHLGDMTTTRAKYLLGQLEKARLAELDRPTEGAPDWAPRHVTIEHIFARSSKESDFDSTDDFDIFSALRDTLANYTILERQLNGDLDNLPFSEKRDTYRKSNFVLTREVGKHDTWSFEQAQKRLEDLGRLAVRAWPLRE